MSDSKGLGSFGMLGLRLSPGGGIRAYADHDRQRALTMLYWSGDPLGCLGRGFRLIACAMLSRDVPFSAFKIDRGLAELERALTAPKDAAELREALAALGSPE
jgi:hypothetical protein